MFVLLIYKIRLILKYSLNFCNIFKIYRIC